MEPRIQYAKTSDGVNIAYWTLGKGLTLVHLPFLVLSHARLEWQRPHTRSFYEHLAERRRLIRYDCRGAGLSDRKVSDHSLEGLVLDLEAVVDRLGLETFALFAPARSGPTAITYAVRNPGRVSHLLLWNSSPRCADHTPAVSTARWQALMTLMQQDWELYADLRALMQHGWSHADEARWAAELMREASSAELVQAFDAALGEVDVTPLLPEVKAPTLVMHRRRQTLLTLDVARGLAARIPNAQLALFEGESGSPYAEEREAILGAIDDFLSVGEAAAVSEPPSGMTAILFADIADSTALTERLGDAAFRSKARDLDTALRAVIREHSGTPIEGKLLGDVVLAVFTSARQAIEAALACGRSGDDAGLPLHLGLHAGDVIREENTVYGGAVNIASRIAGLSAAGEVLVSETVRSLARTSGGVSFEDRGRRKLKGVGEPVRVWAVREGE